MNFKFNILRNKQASLNLQVSIWPITRYVYSQVACKGLLYASVVNYICYKNTSSLAIEMLVTSAPRGKSLPPTNPNLNFVYDRKFLLAANFSIIGWEGKMGVINVNNLP